MQYLLSSDLLWKIWMSCSKNSHTATELVSVIYSRIKGVTMNAEWIFELKGQSSDTRIMFRDLIQIKTFNTKWSEYLSFTQHSFAFLMETTQTVQLRSFQSVWGFGARCWAQHHHISGLNRRKLLRVWPIMIHTNSQVHTDTTHPGTNDILLQQMEK